jgi:subtilisin family serine protease
VAAHEQQLDDYTVLVEDGASTDAAVAAVRAAGGTVMRENAAIGALVVRAPAVGFVKQVSSSHAVFGATRARPIGHLPADAAQRQTDLVEKENLSDPQTAPRADVQGGQQTADMDPLDNKLWGLKMVRADLARDKQAGDKRVYVGVLDTGIDGTHPDIAPNFNAALSRNFTVGIPAIDGPCQTSNCVDPPNVDNNGHSSHVAGTIAAAADGFGISGVAPNATPVNIRGGQNSGFFFLQPVVDALTYGADIGLNVINMSFYLDPWLYNCTANPADSPEAQLEQRTIIAAMQRALNYAHSKDVTLVAALGNNHEDLGKPRTDYSSPDYPANSAYPRPIDKATCLDLPTEGPHVISVSALGPSGAKADFSNYGAERIAVSAPGGYFRDGFGTGSYRTNGNMILSAYPRNVALADKAIDDAGNITPRGAAVGVQKYCDSGVCGYYHYLQGTSMATPHAVGVAALIVSQYGRPDPRRPERLTMNADSVKRILYGTAAKRACPVPPTVSYLNVGRSAEFTATCEGTEAFNGFYGHGIVDAYAAVTRGEEFTEH